MSIRKPGEARGHTHGQQRRQGRGASCKVVGERACRRADSQVQPAAPHLCMIWPVRSLMNRLPRLASAAAAGVWACAHTAPGSLSAGAGGGAGTSPRGLGRRLAGLEGQAELTSEAASSGSSGAAAQPAAAGAPGLSSSGRPGSSRCSSGRWEQPGGGGSASSSGSAAGCAPGAAAAASRAAAGHGWLKPRQSNAPADPLPAPPTPC